MVVMIKNSEKGFNLIEMVIVIFILLTISMITASSFNKYKQKTNFRNATRVISSDYAYLKSKAMSENVQYKIFFDTNNNQYKIMKGGLNGIPSQYDEANAITKYICNFDGDLKISENYPNSQIVFQPRGTVSAGVTLFI